MARYVLSKDNDKIILTDTKTGKKRVLTVEDIDYVVDDNQKLRDENTIATYFRLKEEDFKPKTVTKKANLVQEYKEAKKYDKSDINQTDPMLDFINKFNLTSLERAALIQMPYKETIRKFERPENEKNIMLNDFQRVTEKIIEKNIKNTEEYIKNYLTKYNNDHPVSFDDIFLVSTNYKNTADYEKIKKYIDDGNHIKNLKDLYNQGIKVFANIQLGCLNQLFSNYQKAQNFVKNPYRLVNFTMTSTITGEDNKYWYIKFNLCYPEFNPNVSMVVTVYNPIFDKQIVSDSNTLKSIYEHGLEYFNSIPNISVLSNRVRLLKKLEEENDKEKYEDNFYNYKYKLGMQFVYKEKDKDEDKIKYIPIMPEDDTFKDNSIEESNIQRKKYAKALSIDEKDEKFNELLYAFKALVMDILKPYPSVLAGGNFAGGWTDKTLTRIDVIIDTLKGMGIGMGWSDRTLTRIDNIMSQLNGMGLCSGDEIAGGWTDKTLTRIDNILSQLNGMGLSGGWTDKTLTRIDNILSQLA